MNQRRFVATILITGALLLSAGGAAGQGSEQSDDDRDFLSGSGPWPAWADRDPEDEPDHYLAPVPRQWTTFRYVFTAGSTFRPRASGVSWSYDGGGCVSLGQASRELNLQVHLPDGSRVDYLRLYYYDESAMDSSAWLTTYDGAGGFSDLTIVGSSGESGYGTALSEYLGHVVDNLDGAYVLTWRPRESGAAMRLCGMRIAYRLPE